MQNFNSKFKIFGLILILLPFAFFLFPLQKAYAQQLSLGVYPPIIQINATAPTSIKQALTVVNETDNAVGVTILYKPFTQDIDEDGHVQYLQPGDVFGADPNIFQRMQLLDDNNQPITTFVLSPKEQKKLTLHIGLPKGEPPSDYYFSLVFNTNINGLDNTGSNIAGAIATNVLLSVGPYDKTQGIVDEFSAPWFVQTGPVAFTLRLTNLSRHFIVPRGQVIVRNMFGQPVGNIKLLPVNVLEGTTRRIPGETTNLLSQVVWKEQVLFGIYRANLVVSLAPEGPLFTRVIYFIAIPWEYFLGFFLMVALVSLIIVRVMKRLKN